MAKEILDLKKLTSKFLIGSSSIKISPLLTSRNLQTNFNRRDFPEPILPIIPRNSPELISKFIFFSRFLSSWIKQTFLKEMFPIPRTRFSKYCRGVEILYNR